MKKSALTLGEHVKLHVYRSLNLGLNPAAVRLQRQLFI